MPKEVVPSSTYRKAVACGIATIIKMPNAIIINIEKFHKSKSIEKIEDAMEEIELLSEREKQCIRAMGGITGRLITRLLEKGEKVEEVQKILIGHPCFGAIERYPACGNLIAEILAGPQEKKGEEK